MWMDVSDDLTALTVFVYLYLYLCGWISPMISLEFISDEVDLVHHGVRGRDVLLLLRHWPLHLLHRRHRFLWRQDHIAGPDFVRSFFWLFQMIFQQTPKW